MAPKVEKSKKKKVITETFRNAEVAYRVLVEPWITEKTHANSAIGKYTFKVISKATKKDVSNAVAGMYGVTVIDVNMITVKKKKKSYGRYEGSKAGYKKATVTLKEGESITFFEGV